MRSITEVQLRALIRADEWEPAVSHFGIAASPWPDGLRERIAALPRPLPTRRITLASQYPLLAVQGWVSATGVLEYVADPEEADSGPYGNDLPLLVVTAGGLLLIDGTHRIAAAWVARRRVEVEVLDS